MGGGRGGGQQPIQQPISQQMQVARRQAPPAAAQPADDDDINVAVHRQVRGLLMFDDQGQPMMVLEETNTAVVGNDEGCAVVVQRQLRVIGPDDLRDSPPSPPRNNQRAIAAQPAQQQQQQPTYAAQNIGYVPDGQSLYLSSQQQQQPADDDDADKFTKCSCVCCCFWTAMTIFCLPFLPCICCCVCSECCRSRKTEV